MSPAVLPQAFNLLALLPEMALLLAACIVLLVDATAGEDGGSRIERLALGVLLLPLAAVV